MSFSLKSRLSRVACAALAVILGAALLLNVSLSFVLGRSKSRIEDYLTSALGYRITIGNISSLFNTLKLRDVNIFYGDTEGTHIAVKNTRLSIRILPFFRGKLSISSLKPEDILVPVKKEREGYNLQVMFSNIYNNLAEAGGASLSIAADRMVVTMKSVKLIYPDPAHPDEDKYILLRDARLEQKLDAFRFTAGMQLSYLLPKEAYFSRFLKNTRIQQELKCSIQGNMKGRNLYMNLIVLRAGTDELVGMGVERDFAAKNPSVDITFIPSMISLNNISFLKDNFEADGGIFTSLKVSGLLDNIIPKMSSSLNNCSLKCILPDGETLDIRNLNGEFGYANSLMALQAGFLEINSLPLNFSLKTSRLQEESDISIEASLPEEFLHAQSLYLNGLSLAFNGKIKRSLTGNLRIGASYSFRGADLRMGALLKNIDFDYREKEKSFEADALELTKDDARKIQKLAFHDLKAVILSGKDRIRAKDLEFKGYNGIVKGQADLEIKGSKSWLTFALNGSQLDARSLMQDISVSNKILSGVMNVSIAFDNLVHESLKGRCYIRKGAVDLNLFASMVKFPPMENVDFDIMHVFFSISRDGVKVRGARLSSPDVILNAYWDSNGEVKGTSNIKISSELLKLSPEFRRLLSLTRIKKPYIDFKFLLGGTPEVVRFRWLKGEFRERLRDLLPEDIKKSIQKGLDEMIETVARKKPR